MTPAERKALAMRLAGVDGDNWRLYPKCCNYHEGFDDALGLLAPRIVHDGYRTLYAIEATP